MVLLLCVFAVFLPLTAVVSRLYDFEGRTAKVVGNTMSTMATPDARLTKCN